MRRCVEANSQFRHVEDTADFLSSFEGLEFVFVLEDGHGWFANQSRLAEAVTLLHDLRGKGRSFQNTWSRTLQDDPQLRVVNAVKAWFAFLDERRVKFVLAWRTAESRIPRLNHFPWLSDARAISELAHYLRGSGFAAYDLTA
jgi:hypothetical protein